MDNGEHQQHQRPFAFFLGQAKADHWRASAASSPLRFTLGVGKGGHRASISSMRAPSFHICSTQRPTTGEHQQHQGPFVSLFRQAKADYWRASAASSPLRFTFGVGKGGHRASISSIKAPSFHFGSRQKPTTGEHQQYQGPFVSVWGRQRRTAGGHQQHQRSFAFLLGQAKADHWRASAASSPLRFTFGVGKGGHRASISSMRAASFHVCLRQKPTTGEHQQHQGPFVSVWGRQRRTAGGHQQHQRSFAFLLGQAKADHWRASAASSPLRFTFGVGKGGHRASISSIKAPSFHFGSRQKPTTGEHQQHQGPFVSVWGRQRRTAGGHQQHQRSFAFLLGQAKADHWRASAASSPLRFTFGVGKGGHGASISSIKAPSFHVCLRQKPTTGEHQQHQGPFVSHFGAGKDGLLARTAASAPLRFTIAAGNSQQWKSIRPSRARDSVTNKRDARSHSTQSEPRSVCQLAAKVR